jgi:hypothetical protein
MNEFESIQQEIHDSAPVMEPPAKVVFSPEQQQKVDALIKDAMSRAGKTARAENAELKRELESLKSSAGLDTEGRAELASVKNERDILRQERAENITRSALRSVVGNFLDQELAIDLLKRSVRLTASGGLEVIDEAGNPRLNASYEPMTISELAKEEAARRPFMIKGAMRGGTGSTEAQSSTPSSDKTLVSQIFGPKSNSKLANQMSLQDPKKYARLRKIAIAEGLLG